MITIKQFAALCGCSTQTLRYYDRIDLLKPVKVDQWSSYRYYTKPQAIDFVKIKNLQAADFTIEEIKTLLTLPDQQVYEAFDQKIAVQTQKLERIKEIQQSYLTEVNTMKTMIHSFCDHLMEKAVNPEMLREFDMGVDDARAMVDTIRKLMISCTVDFGEEARTVTMVLDDKLLEGPEAVENMIFLINEEELEETVYLNADHIKQESSDFTQNTELIWEKHGWHLACEFLKDIPAQEADQQYILLIRRYRKPMCDKLSYPFFLIGNMLQKGYTPEKLECYVEPSNDGQNHVLLLRKQ